MLPPELTAAAVVFRDVQVGFILGACVVLRQPYVVPNSLY